MRAICVTCHNLWLVSQRTWPMTSDQCPFWSWWTRNGTLRVFLPYALNSYFIPKGIDRGQARRLAEMRHDSLYLKYIIRYFSVFIYKILGRISVSCPLSWLQIHSPAINQFRCVWECTLASNQSSWRFMRAVSRGIVSRPATVWQPPYTGLLVTKYFVPQWIHSRGQPVCTLLHITTNGPISLDH